MKNIITYFTINTEKIKIGDMIAPMDSTNFKKVIKIQDSFFDPKTFQQRCPSKVFYLEDDSQFETLKSDIVNILLPNNQCQFKLKFTFNKSNQIWTLDFSHPRLKEYCLQLIHSPKYMCYDFEDDLFINQWK